LKEAFFHKDKECGLILEGRFKAIIADQEFILEAGSSMYFDSTIPHGRESVADAEATFVSALASPSLS